MTYSEEKQKLLIHRIDTELVEPFPISLVEDLMQFPVSWEIDAVRNRFVSFCAA